MGELYAGIQTHTPESKAAGLRRLIVGTQMDARNNQLNLQLRVPSSFSSSNKPFDVQMRSYLATLFANADYFVYPVSIPEDGDAGASQQALAGPTLLVTLFGPAITQYRQMFDRERMN